MSIMIQPTRFSLRKSSCWRGREAAADFSCLSTGLLPQLRPFQTGGLKKRKKALQEKRVFLTKFFQSPGMIGSITPSSAYLAEAMVRPVDWDKVRSIVELGAGTGVFTRYIHRRKDPDCQAFIFEQDDEMRQQLMGLYQDMNHFSQAEDIFDVIRESGIHEVDCILSGLPFAIFPQVLRDNILDGVASTLKSGGVFVTFQYSLQMKEQLMKRFRKVQLGFVPLNVPPAFVYYCYK